MNTSTEPLKRRKRKCSADQDYRNHHTDAGIDSDPRSDADDEMQASRRNEIPNICRLPYELLCKVAEFLSPQELSSLAKSCRMLQSDIESCLYRQYGKQAFLWAVSIDIFFRNRDHVSVAEKYIKNNSHRLNDAFENGRTPLITAVECAFDAIVNLLLLDSGVNVNLQSGSLTTQDEYSDWRSKPFVMMTRQGSSWTALNMAARSGQRAVLQRLLNCENIQTGLISKDGKLEGNAIFWAAMEDQHECVLDLLRSPHLSCTAEQIECLLHEAELRRPNSVAGVLLKACLCTDSARSRQDRLNGWTEKTLSLEKMRYLLERATKLSCRMNDNLPVDFDTDYTTADGPAVEWHGRG